MSNQNYYKNYNPILFLASLWLWGTAITFFMYLMFIIPRDKEKFVIPTFNSLKSVWDKWDIWFNSIIVFACIGILFFAFKHIQLLVWNFKNYNHFKKEDINKIKNTPSEITLMAIPLTLAMSVNVWFVLWAVFVPNLWNYVEYLFPIALIAFLLIGIYWMQIFINYLVKIILKQSDINILNVNSFSQLLPSFTFAMVWVWFAASVAMSKNTITIILWLIWSTFFIMLSIVLLIIFAIFWFKAIFEKWIDKPASGSLWIMIPILTLIGITFMRIAHGMHKLWLDLNAIVFTIVTTIIISIQLIIGYIGYKVMKLNWYFKDYIHWKELNPSVYSIICPWVALVVFGFFFLHNGILLTKVIDKFSIVYFILLVPIIYLQFKTIYVMFKLNKKFFGKI